MSFSRVDTKEAVATALAHRPEVEALRQQMAANDITIRLDHNALLPNLSLNGIYDSNGLGGNQYNTSVMPPVLVSRGGLGDAFSQIGGFGYPTYGFTLSLNLPIKNHSAEANLGNAMVARRRTQYLAREQEENIALQVATAVHQLEQARISLDATRVAYDLSRKTLEAEERKYQLGASNDLLCAASTRPCSPRRRPRCSRRKSTTNSPAPPSTTPPACSSTITKSKCRRSNRDTPTAAG